MVQRSSVVMLPEAVRKWLDKALADGNFSGYQQLEVELKGRGFDISKSAIHRYGKKLQSQLKAIKQSTQAAVLISEAAPDDADLRSSANISMLQTQFFDIFLALQEMEALAPEEVEDRLKVLAKASKAISELSRASVNQKKWQTTLEAEIRADERAKAAEAATSAAKSNGVSEETIATIRRDVLGMDA